MADNDEEVDLFDLSIQAPGSDGELGETETNVMSIEFDSNTERKSTELKPGVSAKIPSLMSGAGDDEEVFEAAPVVEEEAVDGLSESSVFEMAPAPKADPVPVVEEEPIDGLSESSVFEMVPAPKADPVPVVEEEPIDGLSESSVFEMAPAPKEEGGSDFKTEFESVDGISESSVFEIAPVVDDIPDFERQEHRFETVTVPAVSDYDPDAEPDFETSAYSPGSLSGEDEFDLSAAAPAAAATAAATEPEPAPEPLPPPVFNKIAHVCLHVKDLEVSSEFYTRLGFNKRFSFNRDGELFGAYFEFGDGNFVEIFEDQTLDDTSKRGRLAHFCLETPNIDEVMASLDSRGIEYTPKKLGCDATYQIWLKDPDGNEFEVHQYTDDSSQIVGRDVVADW